MGIGGTKGLVLCTGQCFDEMEHLFLDRLALLRCGAADPSGARSVDGKYSRKGTEDRMRVTVAAAAASGCGTAIGSVGNQADAFEAGVGKTGFDAVSDTAAGSWTGKAGELEAAGWGSVGKCNHHRGSDCHGQPGGSIGNL